MWQSVAPAARHRQITTFSLPRSQLYQIQPSYRQVVTLFGVMNVIQMREKIEKRLTSSLVYITPPLRHLIHLVGKCTLIGDPPERTSSTNTPGSFYLPLQQYVL